MSAKAKRKKGGAETNGQTNGALTEEIQRKQREAMRVPLIADGETRRAYIDGVPGQYPPVRFVYRRHTALSLLPVTHGTDLLSTPQGEAKIRGWAQTVANQVIGFCTVDPVTNQNAEPVESVDVEFLLRIDPFLFMRIFLVVKGQAESDVDPLDGTTNLTAEADAKNLGRG